MSKLPRVYYYETLDARLEAVCGSERPTYRSIRIYRSSAVHFFGILRVSNLRKCAIKRYNKRNMEEE